MMGDKRPEHHASEGGEVGATDRTQLDEKLHEAEKQELTESRADIEHESRIPKSGKNPALAELQAARARQAAEARTEESAGADGTE